MRAKSLLLLMLALGCGLVASIGITQVMAKRGAGAAAPSGEMATIFVALEDIPMGDLVTAQVLKLEEWPKDKVPPGALSKMEDVEGRRPKSKIVAGMPILDSQLLDKGVSAAGAAPQIPLGYRVVSVRVDDESGISNMIRPRDRVDVLLYMKQTPGIIVETSTRTILQDIQVFAVNDVFLIEETEDGRSLNARTISLLVTPGQAEVVTLASELGEIRLALRSHEDKEYVDSPGAFPHELDRSEPSNRDMEALATTPPATNSGNMDGFLDLLSSRGSQEPAAPEPEEEADFWTVQLIQGSQISEVVLEMVDAQATAQGPDAQSSGFVRWRTTATEVGTGFEGDAVDPDQDESAVDQAEEEETGEEQADEQDAEEIEEED